MKSLSYKKLRKQLSREIYLKRTIKNWDGPGKSDKEYTTYSSGNRKNDMLDRKHKNDIVLHIVHETVYYETVSKVQIKTISVNIMPESNHDFLELPTNNDTIFIIPRQKSDYEWLPGNLIVCKSSKDLQQAYNLIFKNCPEGVIIPHVAH